MNPLDFNKEFDYKLKSTNVLSYEIIKKFDKAYSYDAASSINWLTQKLKIIKARIEEGQQIFLENQEINLDSLSFKTWVCNKYPGIISDLFS